MTLPIAAYDPKPKSPGPDRMPRVDLCRLCSSPEYPRFEPEPIELQPGLGPRQLREDRDATVAT